MQNIKKTKPNLFTGLVHIKLSRFTVIPSHSWVKNAIKRFTFVPKILALKRLFPFKPGGSAALTGAQRVLSAAIPHITLQDEICVTQAVQGVPSPGDDLPAPVWDTDVLGANSPPAQDKLALHGCPKDLWRGGEPWQMWSYLRVKWAHSSVPPRRESRFIIPKLLSAVSPACPALQFHSCNLLPASSKSSK